MNLLGYIDPATTALVWQVLAGIFVSLGVFIGMWWRKVSTFFKGLFVGKKRKIDSVDSEELRVFEAELDEITETEKL